MYTKVFYSIIANKIILEWDKTACRFVYFTGLGLGLRLAFFKEDLDSDLDLSDLDLNLDLAVAVLVTSLINIHASFA